eukprot:7508744-Pyramimonas_sp.AAC.1
MSDGVASFLKHVAACSQMVRMMPPSASGQPEALNVDGETLRSHANIKGRFSMRKNCPISFSLSALVPDLRGCLVSR